MMFIEVMIKNYSQKSTRCLITFLHSIPIILINHLSKTHYIIITIVQHFEIKKIIAL